MITGKNFYLHSSSSILEVINNINDSQYQICFIVDNNNHLIGSITDGDIRRGLINGFTTESKAEEVMQKSPISIGDNKGEIEARKLMESNEIKQLPVVNIDNCLVGLFLWDDVTKIPQRENTILIMAGGFGKRMMPLTENLPKPMLSVGGKPILERIIINARDQGFRQFSISLFYLGEMIEEYFGDGSKLDVSIEYIKETEPLGTAGSLSLLKPKSKAPFIVTNGDLLTEVNYANLLDFHSSNRSDATMAIKKYELQNPYGVVNTNGFEISSFEEKPIQISYVNAGIYVINPETLKFINKKKFCDMPNFFMKLKNQNLLINAYPIHETWSDLGSPDDISDANR